MKDLSFSNYLPLARAKSFNYECTKGLYAAIYASNQRYEGVETIHFVTFVVRIPVMQIKGDDEDDETQIFQHLCGDDLEAPEEDVDQTHYMYKTGNFTLTKL